MQKQDWSLGLLALGANLPTSLGNPRDSLIDVLDRLPGPEIRLIAVSRFWQTPAFPAGSGPDYVNGAALVETRLTPRVLLDYLHEIEAEMGRRRDGGRWGARVIDIDLIGYDDLVLPDAGTQDAWRGLALERQMVEAPDQLILPHPRMQDRAFVLAPLAEIAPLWQHPRIGASVAEMLAALPPDSFEGMRVMGS
ncbi:2-amino-4-hydroxy-6-hydroxymethyldihydropteridine diphosphokinase [Paracoccus aminophilus]|uniref:2-amino-4-hydroxy-6-hydroxymethyldihydropteridine pyrophosphokinase n=1 Tax=Paracoccus aminophilus JCM 7686 TaxID=1367847 RepID=S5YV53_PARAH|nr:2-amino-4-hydroxy-6-hydroxymethyldihydropteridine diphosphokinase [Paracoccus aminophilus]AGT09051.1 2-amino-4-hydroxy-6-hydroxymethyldihydropteridine pyrophosphokinase [Paracoccus aminophilus JCM 7686]